MQTRPGQDCETRVTNPCTALLCVHVENAASLFLPVYSLERQRLTEGETEISHLLVHFSKDHHG